MESKLIADAYKWQYLHLDSELPENFKSTENKRVPLS